MPPYTNVLISPYTTVLVDPPSWQLPDSCLRLSSELSKMASGGIEMLFACTHCHKRYKMEELSSTQQLCKACRKRFPSIPCSYCRMEFHPTEGKSLLPACDSCAKELKQYGKPSICTICGQKSAFKGSKCTRCSHSEKKYGAPVPCEQCGKQCAFRKNDDNKQKVGGKVLCLLCTLNYKKAQFKQKNRHPKHHHDPAAADQPKSKRRRTDDPPAPFSTYSSISAPTAHTSVSKDTAAVDPLSSELMQETERLREQVSNLKRQVSQKDQALLEKDKTICSLRAENLEKDKEYRQRLQGIQRTHNEQVDNLKVDIQGLKKQLSQQTTKPKAKPHPPASSVNTLLKSS